MKTTLYLIRHGATEANLARPPRLQGRHDDPPLASFGVRQAELTRDVLAIRPIDHCYSSPLLRARETAVIVAEPHELEPQPVPELIECDVGRWEGLDWLSIRTNEPEAYEHYMANPAKHGYPGGENFAEVYERVSAALEDLLNRHAGQAILVVSHHVVNRIYLAQLLGLSIAQARRVSLDNCGISIVVREGTRTWVSTLNASFHLQGAAA
jgi:broad specificity phosphatase PhoE